ncbi:MAG: hypothetical protein JJU45_07900 [Acidimicrobiia bacterium]|nr:hypothetical protein [Acidimicrobiia bacterium]
MNRGDRQRIVALCAFAPLLVLGALAGCSGDDGEAERAEVIGDLRRTAPANVTDEQLGCYVDRVADELGPHLLSPDRESSAAQVRALARIRLDCLGVATSGRPAPLADGIPEELRVDRELPWAPGDDPELDALWRACEDANMAACDQLFDDAVPGSPYERFGATCGGRGAAEVCDAPRDPTGEA